MQLTPLAEPAAHPGDFELFRHPKLQRLYCAVGTGRLAPDGVRQHWLPLRGRADVEAREESARGLPPGFRAECAREGNALAGFYLFFSARMKASSG